MRLIDADYLKTWFGEKDIYGYDYIISTIDDATTIELERKKGKWIDDKCSACGYKCSACGYRVEPWNNTPYCPNCGCRMGEEQDDDK